MMVGKSSGTASINDYNLLSPNLLSDQTDNCQLPTANFPPMPELPDVLLYQSALERFVAGRRLAKLIVRGPFVLRTFEVELDSVRDKAVEKVSRLGKRLIFELADDYFIVVHLMIAGRFHWKKASTLPKGKLDLAAFCFDHGTLMLTEASSQKRAGIWIVRGRAAVNQLHAPGLNPLIATAEEFTAVLKRSNNTLKRALADPHRFDGIGNAYSDEILHAARLSPLQLTRNLDEAECRTLHQACRDTLMHWIELLQTQNGQRFPEKVTAFRPEMAVHGKYGEPCPVCQSAVQRIRYADNECNYCARCQTQGRLLSDRSLSRLLKDDWPATLDEWESM